VYRLSMPEPHTHRFHVEMHVEGVAGPARLVMPAWTPGSYLIREFARNVQWLQAEDGAGRTLTWRKEDKLTWRVEAPEDGRLRVRYAVYANELSVRTSHLDASHGYVNGASVFFYVAGREREPILLQVAAPEGWRASTGLTRTGRPEVFRAADYDELVDSPLEIGTHEVVEWESEGRPHRYAVWGRGNYDLARLVQDTAKVVSATRELFGGPLPYDDYTFILHAVPGQYGGLEHRNSTSLIVDRWGFRGREYEKAIALVAHELFHAWNGKRIRPEPLGPFDYTRENYTRNLWVVEGFTTYYTELVLRRAGILSPQRFLERLGDAISSYHATPGRLRQTLEESSFDAWIRFYRQDENSPNALVSYYQKGMLVAMLLDLRIREVTENRRSLDDVLRLLWERYGKPDVGFPEAGIEQLVAEVCGERLDDFFASYLRSTEELDFERHLWIAGLELVPAPAGSATAGGPPPSTLGLRLKDEGGRTLVTHVLADTPAYRAGVGAGDEILACDGLRVSPRDLPARIQERREGEEVALTLFRRDELMTLPLRVEHRAPPRVALRRIAHAGPMQTAVYEAWLGFFPSPGG
ncbi:MAG: PDZ domain-containing protein, partial [Gemmatimonadota bacterium]|nr:PDZ domain-containing protein [Gemmatimonadota bacterium]